MLHDLQQLLIDLGICQSDSFTPYHSKTRDDDTIKVLQCKISGVKILSQIDHMNLSHYEEQDNFGTWTASQRDQARKEFYQDDQRRALFLKDRIINKTWIDVGTETGGLLELLRPESAQSIGVEPKDDARQMLQADGFEMYPLLEDISKNNFADVVSFFHVLEHIITPLENLKKAFDVLKPGGLLVLEVPHSKDFLLETLDCEAFKNFTFWSEHLILHTRESLSSLAQAAGFSQITVQGIQRYPLSNHLHWLTKAKPGGHIQWADIDSKNLNEAYESNLQRLNQTDTLLLTARKPN